MDRLSSIFRPHFIVGDPEDPYLLRWYLIPRNRFFNIYLHKFLKSDDDRATHDHPWYSLSFILSGSYEEFVRLNLSKQYDRWPDLHITKRFDAGSVILRSAKHSHIIKLIDRNPVWTIFMTGPKIREWGFWCPKGWRHWRDYTKAEEIGNSIGRGCE